MIAVESLAKRYDELRTIARAAGIPVSRVGLIYLGYAAVLITRPRSALSLTPTRCVGGGRAIVRS